MQGPAWWHGCAVVVFSVTLAWARPALAAPQAAVPPPTPPAPADGAPFLPRLDFSFQWASLLTSDDRFDWRGQIEFDLDMFDYGSGRASFVGRYEGIIGRERRRYDLNQGYYFFEASASVRTKPAEIVVLSQHVSRHTVDRENQPAISWNTLGVRAERGWGGAPKPGWAGTRVDGEIEINSTWQLAFVDYRWIGRARATLRRPISPNLSFLFDANAEVIGVDPETRGRSRVCGGRIEGALRVAGKAATVELFAGYERRIDAYPTDRYRVRWFTAGFRITSW